MIDYIASVCVCISVWNEKNSFVYLYKFLYVKKVIILYRYIYNIQIYSYTLCVLHVHFLLKKVRVLYTRGGCSVFDV